MCYKSKNKELEIKQEIIVNADVFSSPVCYDGCVCFGSRDDHFYTYRFLNFYNPTYF